MYALGVFLALLSAISIARAHTVITYPGWRGNNLHTNGTLPAQNPDSIGIDFSDNGTVAFPWGQQWMYPCGGMPQSTNRTKWPVHGGGISIQPGWFPGHSFAMFYINIGITERGALAPPNMSHPVVPPFQLVGPNNFEYPGQFCLPQVGMPKNLDLEVGTNITIQVVELAQHGAALYNCVDVTLTEPEEVELITKDNCYNSSNLAFNLVYATTPIGSAAPAILSTPSTAAFALLAAALVSLVGGFLA